MADVYASAVGTTVLQIREIPVCPSGLEREYNRRPYEERGWCCFEDAVSRELLVRRRRAGEAAQAAAPQAAASQCPGLQFV